MKLRKYLSKFGVGCAAIDLKLPKTNYEPGEYIAGHFLIKGGAVEQKIKRIECDLIMVDGMDETEKIIDSTTILSSKFIRPQETSQVSFSYQLPETIENSSSLRSYRFTTKMIFNEGVKSIDHDDIEIIHKQ
ncbi:sporulation protein [Bacillus sp. V3-13]|uniref:sporulation protein n=1 Tax=Bacillus sp. V3-13 TaxID=2053728 RepID=UPI000C790B4D|nr:sporulation protein [Bacillus sp. V3-13]PLR76625.1 sporulation protein [Bacillus sp. V3-13]